MRQLLIVIVLVALPLFIIGCGELNFEAARLKNNWSQETLSSVRTEVTGNVDNSLLGNYQAITVDTDKKEIILTLPAPNLFKDWQGEIPKLHGAVLTSSVDRNDKTLLRLHYPIVNLVAQFEKGFGYRQVLPNGQNIPGVPGGKMYSQKIKIDKDHTVFVYFDKGYVAMLLNVPFDPLIVTTFPIKRKDNVLGYVNTIPKRGGEAGGLLISAIIPDAVMKKLESE
jgi:hypothetical protein